MKGDYEPETVKAQAVIARSELYRRKRGKPFFYFTGEGKHHKTTVVGKCGKIAAVRGGCGRDKESGSYLEGAIEDCPIS